MGKNRIEAFTDGVIAIIITIMVLEIEVPKEMTSAEIMNLISNILVYLLSFIYVGIYWTNHHHLFGTVKKINGKVLWVNLILLFFLSLIPLATKWVNLSFGTASLFFYGFCLFMSAITYFVLVKVLVSCDHNLTSEIYSEAGFKKEVISILLYVIGVVFTFISYPISILMYIIVAFIWIVPDRKMERNIYNKDKRNYAKRNNK